LLALSRTVYDPEQERVPRQARSAEFGFTLQVVSAIEQGVADAASSNRGRRPEL